MKKGNRQPAQDKFSTPARRRRIIADVAVFLLRQYCTKACSNVHRQRVERAASTRMQCAIRSYLARRELRRLRMYRRWCSAVCIQSIWRSHHAQNILWELKREKRRRDELSLAIAVQCAWRGLMARRRYRVMLREKRLLTKMEQDEAAVSLQTFIRMNLLRRKYLITIKEIRREAERRRIAAIKIQCVWRGCLGRKRAIQYRQHRASAIILQRSLSKHLFRSRSKKKKAAVTLQRVGRGLLSRVLAKKTLEKEVQDKLRRQERLLAEQKRQLEELQAELERRDREEKTKRLEEERQRALAEEVERTIASTLTSVVAETIHSLRISVVMDFPLTYDHFLTSLIQDLAAGASANTASKAGLSSSRIANDCVDWLTRGSFFTRNSDGHNDLLLLGPALTHLLSLIGVVVEVKRRISSPKNQSKEHMLRMPHSSTVNISSWIEDLNRFQDVPQIPVHLNESHGSLHNSGSSNSSSSSSSSSTPSHLLQLARCSFSHRMSPDVSVNPVPVGSCLDTSNVVLDGVVKPQTLDELNSEAWRASLVHWLNVELEIAIRLPSSSDSIPGTATYIDTTSTGRGGVCTSAQRVIVGLSVGSDLEMQARGVTGNSTGQDEGEEVVLDDSLDSIVRAESPPLMDGETSAVDQQWRDLCISSVEHSSMTNDEEVFSKVVVTVHLQPPAPPEPQNLPSEILVDRHAAASIIQVAARVYLQRRNSFAVVIQRSLSRRHRLGRWMLVVNMAWLQAHRAAVFIQAALRGRLARARASKLRFQLCDELLAAAETHLKERFANGELTHDFTADEKANWLLLLGCDNSTRHPASLLQGHEDAWTGCSGSESGLWCGVDTVRREFYERFAAHNGGLSAIRYPAVPSGSGKSQSISATLSLKLSKSLSSPSATSTKGGLLIANSVEYFTECFKAVNCVADLLAVTNTECPKPFSCVLPTDRLVIRPRRCYEEPSSELTATRCGSEEVVNVVTALPEPPSDGDGGRKVPVPPADQTTEEYSSNFAATSASFNIDVDENHEGGSGGDTAELNSNVPGEQTESVAVEQGVLDVLETAVPVTKPSIQTQLQGLMAVSIINASPGSTLKPTLPSAPPSLAIYHNIRKKFL